MREYEVTFSTIITKTVIVVDPDGDFSPDEIHMVAKALIDPMTITLDIADIVRVAPKHD